MDERASGNRRNLRRIAGNDDAGGAAVSRWICGAAVTLLILLAMGGSDKADAAVEANEQAQVRAVQWSDLDQAARGLTDFDRPAK